MRKAPRLSAYAGLGRLALWCGLSVLLYATAFGLVLDRPLSLGLVRQEIIDKTDRMAALPSPKLVIIAGSNAPYSHSCAVIGAMLKMPCENAGVAVGIGLDDLFARYVPLLHRGDVVYLPMEMQQYVVTKRQNDAAVDGAFLFRHDRAILLSLEPSRIIGAAFCCDLADFLESLAELPLADEAGFAPQRVLQAEYDLQGDRIDNDLADADPDLLHLAVRTPPQPGMIEAGFGTALIAKFTAQESQTGVIVVGGLPTDISTATAAAAANVSEVAAIYTANGGRMLVLPGHSGYPAKDFYNSEDHLVRPCQYLHSISVARGLAVLLGWPVNEPAAAVAAFAATCPSSGD